MASVKGYKTSSRTDVKVVENMATSDVNFLMEKGLDGEEDYPGPYDSEPPSEKTDEIFVVKAGDPDAGNMGVYTNGKIEFEIAIDRYYGELQDPYDPNKAYLNDPDRLENNNVISKAQLILIMYDLDPDEFDTIKLNGYSDVAVVREDANNLWKKVTVNIPLDKIKFPNMGTETSPPVPRNNKIAIYIDSAKKGYKTRCEWAAITVKAVRPIVFIHGKGSNSMEWSFGGEYGAGQGWHNFRGNFDDKGLITDVVDYWPEDNPYSAVIEGKTKETCNDWIDNDGEGHADYYVDWATKMAMCNEDLTECISKSKLKVKEATKEFTSWYSIVDQMAQIKNKYGVNDINIVAHSMGGLVARAYINHARHRKDTYPMVKNLFMLGTPNLGTPAADVSKGPMKYVLGKLVYSPSVEYLTTEYIEKFNTWVQEAKEVKYFTIAAAGGWITDTIPDPWHWFDDPSEYHYKMNVSSAIISWEVIRNHSKGGENDNLVPVKSTQLENYTNAIHLYTDDLLNHHTIRDNNYIGNLILNVLLNNTDNTETLSRSKLYEDLDSSPDSTPLTGSMNTQNPSISPGETKTHSITLNQCEEVLFSLSWLDTSQNLVLSVIDPNNHTITEADTNVTFADEQGFSFYSITNPKPGTWQLLIDGSNNLASPVDYSLTTIITGNGLSHSLVADKDFYQQNQPILITQTLKEWDNPILDANITVSIIDPNHNEIIVTLLDDGIHGDTAASDGLYSNTVNSLTIGGSYYISSSSQGAFSDGTEFSSIDFTSFSISKADASITGDFTETLEDIDGDGLHNTLLIRVSLDVLKENSYLLVGELHNGDGKQITWSKATVLLSPGQQTIDLAFDGNEIFASAIDGPYYLNNLTLWLEEDGNYKLDEIKNAYITSAYSHREFQRAKIDISADGIFDQGIDVNGNGKFDFLEIRFNLDLTDEADYTIDAALTTGDNQPIAGINRAYHLYPGINTVSINFPGTKIYESNQNSPYLLKDISVSSSKDSFTLSDKLYQTKTAYLFTDFDKPAPNPPTGISINAIVNGLQISWNQGEDNPAGYKIYYGLEKGDYPYTQDANSSLSFQLTGMQGGKRYFIALTAYNDQNSESGFSAEVEAVPQILEGDTDGDGLPDTWENNYEGLNLFDPNDAALDPDEDGLDNLTEYKHNTNPINPDSDEDGFIDSDEITKGSSPTDAASIPNRTLAIYYGWPSAVNHCPDLACAASVFSRFKVLILGDGLEHPDHGDHEPTKLIIANLHTPPNHTAVYGYIDLGMTGTTSNLPIETVIQYIEEWLAMGVDGIFFDDAGWDFQVERSRLNQAVNYAHNQGLLVILNAWNPDDVLSDYYHEIYNPDSLSSPLLPEDGYLSEGYQISQGEYQDPGLWAAKADKCLTYKQSLGINIYCVATGDDTASDALFQDKFDYFLWSFILYGFDYYQYTNSIYSASNGPANEPWANSLIYHPDQGINYAYVENTITHSHENHCHTRSTSDGGKVYVIGDGLDWGMGGISRPSTNTPPAVYAPSPADKASNQPIDLTLSWHVIDPDEDAVTYELFLTQGDHNTIINGLQTSDTSYSVTNLSYSSDYTWQIKATDSRGAQTLGPVWSFSTSPCEICDGIDNDGDGEVDEDFDLETDPNNCGACGHACQYAHAIGLCSGGICVMGTCDNGYHNLNNDPADGCEYACTISNAGLEICDNIDNDCDGNVDEDLTQDCSTACGTGTETCLAGQWENCTAPSVETEVCNDGTDNNCNGLIDEGCMYQEVSISPEITKVPPSGAFTLTINYNVSDGNNKLSGLGINIHFDSSKLEYKGYGNFLDKGDFKSLPTFTTDTNNEDGDPNTDKMINMSWVSTPGQWPDENLPLVLAELNFTVNCDVETGQETRVNISSFEHDVNYRFVGKGSKVTINPCSLDIDDNGEVKALTDGLLIMRYLFRYHQLYGDSWIEGVVATNCTRCTAQEIENHIESLIDNSCLDIDDNGEAKALTDGLLIMRYLFRYHQLYGDSWIEGVVATNCGQCTAQEIENYISLLISR